MSGARVLHVFKYFRPRFTGEGIFVERLAPIFGALRPDVIHDVVATATSSPGNLAAPQGLGTVHYLAARGREASQGTVIAWLIRNAHRYGTIHYHTHVDRTFLASLYLRLSGARVLLSATLDDSVPGILKTYRPMFRPLVRTLIKTISQFIAISEKLFDENRRFVPGRKSELLPIGVVIPELFLEARRHSRARLGLAPDTLVLVCVGGICERKNQLFLVQQLPALLRRHGDLVLLLVGPVLDDSYKARIDALIADQGLGKHIRFTGYADAPWEFYSAADIMAFASQQEGFGTVVIEAMAYGLPIVARHLPGVNDMFVEHGRSGYLFDCPDQFQQHVSDLAASPQLRKTMGGAGRAFVTAHHDISTIAARYLSLYGYPAQGNAV